MERSVLELELLTLKYKYYTEEVRHSIDRNAPRIRHPLDSDTVIDGIWRECQKSLKNILSEKGITGYSGRRPTYPPLSNESRETIKSYLKQAREYEIELEMLEDDAFEEVFRVNIAPAVEAERARRTRMAQDNDRWAFFNHPAADVDLAEWRDRRLLPAQATAISFGKDPNVVTPERLASHCPAGGSPFRDKFDDRLEIIKSAVSCGEISDPTSIEDFARWAAGRGFKLPPELTVGVTAAADGDAAFWKIKYEAARAELDNTSVTADDVGLPSRNSLYRLILGMAIARFEHRTGQNSSAVKAIETAISDLEIDGLKIREDTIRKALNAASEKLEVQHENSLQWRGVRKKI